MLKILISNDDGVHAPGIKILAQTLRSVADVYVVAPLEERSTTGHTLTLDFPLRVVKIDEKVWGCSGYPADCSLMGFGHLMDERPDLVVSGINRGANLGQDIYYSGTVAAAREATFHGIPSISVSSVIDFLPTPSSKDYYQTAADYIKFLVCHNIHQLIKPLNVLNVNVPNVAKEEIAGVEHTTLGFRKYCEDISKRTDFRERPYYWVGGIYKGFEGESGTDCFAVNENKISLTELNLLGQTTDQNPKWSQLLSHKTW